MVVLSRSSILSILFGVLLFSSPHNAYACDRIYEEGDQFYVMLCFGADGFPHLREEFTKTRLDTGEDVFLKNADISFSISGTLGNVYRSFEYRIGTPEVISIDQNTDYDTKSTHFSFEQGRISSIQISDYRNPAEDTFIQVERGEKTTFYRYFHGHDVNGVALYVATLDSTTGNLLKIRFFKEGTHKIIADKVYTYKKGVLRQVVHHTLVPTTRVLDIALMTADGENTRRITKYRADGSVSQISKYVYSPEKNFYVDLYKSSKSGESLTFVERDSFAKSRPGTLVEQYKSGARTGIGYAPFYTYRINKASEDESLAPLYAVRNAAANLYVPYGRTPSPSWTVDSRWSSTTLPKRGDYLALLQQELVAYELYATHGQGSLTELMIGDSHTFNFRPEYFPSGSWDWVNQGIPGDTTALIKTRVALFDNSDLLRIYVQAGNTDVLQGKSDEVILQGIVGIIDAIRAHHPNTAIYIQSLLPIGSQKENPGKNITNARIAALNSAIQLLLGDKNTQVQYLDIHSALVDPATGALDTRFSKDGFNLTQLGYAAWAKVISQISPYPVS